MSLPRQVSYQIRYDGNVTGKWPVKSIGHTPSISLIAVDETVIKFMTDGVLLKEIEQVCIDNTVRSVAVLPACVCAPRAGSHRSVYCLV